MSLIRRNNNFKSKNIGSLKDYQDKYEYLKERNKQKYTYQRERTKQDIDRNKNDRTLKKEELLTRICRRTNKLKLVLVKELTNTHTVTIITFSLVSGIMSAIGVLTKVNGVWNKIIVLILTIILMLSNNKAIQPKFINSLLLKKNIENIIGSVILGVVTLGVFYISIITNKETLKLLQLPLELSFAFTLAFDLSVLGLNFLHYSTVIFDVKDKVKQDLNLVDKSVVEVLPTIKEQPKLKQIGFVSTVDNTPTSKKIEEYLNKLDEGAPVNLKEINCNYSTALKYCNEHKEKLPIEKDKTNSKYKFVKKGY